MGLLSTLFELDNVMTNDQLRFGDNSDDRLFVVLMTFAFGLIIKTQC